MQQYERARAARVVITHVLTLALRRTIHLGLFRVCRSYILFCFPDFFPSETLFWGGGAGGGSDYSDIPESGSD